MKFARVVVRIAAVWGVLVLTPLYFMANRFGDVKSPAGAQFYFGFLAVTMAWQLAFWVIGSDPVRFRPMMLPAIHGEARLRCDARDPRSLGPHRRH